MSVNARDQRDAGSNSPTAQQPENSLKLAVEHCEANFQREPPAPGKPVTVESSMMVNHAARTETCQIAFDVHNDEQLGKFYVDNGMSDIPGNLPEILYEILDYRGQTCHL